VEGASKMFLLPFFLLSISLSAEIMHQKIPYFLPKYRTEVELSVNSNSQILLSKLYFKSGAGRDFQYVKMKCKGVTCRGTIPATDDTAETIHYFIELFIGKRVETSTVYSVERYSEPLWITRKSDSPIYVSPTGEVSSTYLKDSRTPVNGNSKALDGFTDKIVINRGRQGYSLERRKKEWREPRRGSGSYYSPIFTP
jgi:hypothetical protein